MDVREYLANADAAFANTQYETALGWYQKVLEVEPNHVYALTRAGSICVPMKRFQEALDYFRRVVELEPKNGDALYNYGNACFFTQDNVTAFSSYVKAVQLGCSEGILPRLYYQMAMLCSIRQDIDSALIYFKKCEAADKTGVVSLKPDLVSEKMKLYLLQQDFANASAAAAQLVALTPGNFRNYMASFSLMMTQHQYTEAETLLKDCETYAEMTADDRAALALQYATLYVALGQTDAGQRTEYFDRAAACLEAQLQETGMGDEAVQNMQLTLADILQRSGKYDEAIRVLQRMLTGKAPAAAEAEDGGQEPVPELTAEELDAMIYADVNKIYDLVVAGELAPDLGIYAEIVYDEYGNQVPVIPDAAFDAMDNIPQETEEEAPETEEPAPAPEVPADRREKAYYTLLTCCLAKDDLTGALKLAALMKQSENKYYSYYGRYAMALMERKLHGATEAVEQRYAKELAFFRGRYFADPSDMLAIIFRARLYAEQGSYTKAEELAKLLAGQDQTSVLEYIESCRNGN